MTDERYIVIPGWERFQNADVLKKAGRGRLPWIKVHVDLLTDDAYLGLTGHQRAVLHGLHLAYASSGCQLVLNTASLSRRLGLRVSSAQLEALNHAGLIEVSSRVEVEVERERTYVCELQDVARDDVPTQTPEQIEELEAEGRAFMAELEAKNGSAPVAGFSQLDPLEELRKVKR